MSVSDVTGHTSIMKQNNLDFPDFPGLRDIPISAIFQWDLGSRRVCNQLGMAVGFKWTDSQPISNHTVSFSLIFKISSILVLIRVV